MTLDIQSRTVVSRGYDWANSVFDDPSTHFLKGIIYFSLGDYESESSSSIPKVVQNSITAALDGIVPSPLRVGELDRE